MPRYFRHTSNGFSHGTYAEWPDGSEYVACVPPNGLRIENMWNASDVPGFLAGGHWVEIPPLVRRFRHAVAFNDGTDYVELPDGAPEGYCIMQDGKRGETNLTSQFILNAVADGAWVEIPVTSPHTPKQETAVVRYFKHRNGFVNYISHAELRPGQTAADAIYRDGSRYNGAWSSIDTEWHIRTGEWIEFLPYDHDLFIDQDSYNDALQLQHTERIARYERWKLNQQRAHERLVRKCFTDTRSRRWPLNRRNWAYWKEQAKRQGCLAAELIAQFNKNPSLHALCALHDHARHRRYKSTTINTLLDRYLDGECNFGDNIWHSPPWNDESWYRNSEHYARQAHVSVKNPMNVAFHESLDKLERDIQTVMKPGRFLQRFFSDVLSEQEIREWAHRWERMNAPPEVRFIENTDPSGWVDVYSRDHGFDSCMTGERCVKVYAHPGNSLRLAYMVEPENEDHVIARAIVVEKKKAYVRCYGDDRLVGALEALGYRYEDGALVGESLAKIEHSHGWLMPYLDAQCKKRTGSYSSLCVNDMGGHFEVTEDGEYSCGNTEGYVERGYECPNCGRRCDEDDLHYSDYHDTHFCSGCEGEFTWAHVSAYEHDYVRETVEVDGEFWVDDYHVLRRNGFEPCAECDEWHHSDNMTATSRGLVCACTEVIELAIDDHYGNSYACADDTKTAIEIATGAEMYIHEETNYDEEYADPDTLERLPLPTGSQTRPHDERTHELFAA